MSNAVKKKEKEKEKQHILTIIVNIMYSHFFRLVMFSNMFS